MFWREWSAACRAAGMTTANGWTSAQIDNERHALLSRAGFDSLTRVDKLAGFDRVISELKVLSHPADMDAQLRQEGMPRKRLYFAIDKLGQQLSHAWSEGAPFGSIYIGVIMLGRWGHQDPDRLSEADLTQLRNTLADRLVQEHKPATQARRAAANHHRRAEPKPPGRIALAPSPMPDAATAAQDDNTPF